MDDLVLLFIFLLAFLVWTLLVTTVDVRPIGQGGSSVGLATVNGAFHAWTGVHLTLYTLTDWLSLIPLGIVAAFAAQGLLQWLRRRSLVRVDRDILVLGGYYLAVLAVYVLFEFVTVNYRPLLIEGVLEVSYPSSTTMLVLCVIPTAVMRLRARLPRRLLTAFALFMVVARLLSGVHWLTDIVGGLLLSAALVHFYRAFCPSET
jgi:undecaprenyl-diphosphatase